MTGEYTSRRVTKFNSNTIRSKLEVDVFLLYRESF